MAGAAAEGRMVSRKKMGIAMTVVVLAFVAVLVVLSMTGGSDMYTPTTDDAAVIFREACARCHNERGAGGSGIGKKLAGKRVPVGEVKQIIQEGDGRMPRFPNVQGEALERLARYVNGL